MIVSSLDSARRTVPLEASLMSSLAPLSTIGPEPHPIFNVSRPAAVR